MITARATSSLYFTLAGSTVGCYCSTKVLRWKIGRLLGHDNLLYNRRSARTSGDKLPHRSRQPVHWPHVAVRVAGRSKRSRFITLVQAATKSWTNFLCASELPYTSERARSCALEPKIRSARVAVQRTSPDLRSRPSKVSFLSDVAFHAVRISSRLTKKSLVKASGFLVKTPNLVWPWLVFNTRRPPINTVSSGAVSVRSCALSSSSTSAVPSAPPYGRPLR